MIRRLFAVALAFSLAQAAYALRVDPSCAAGASSFELLQRAIFDRHDCTLSYCHGADQQAGLDLRAGYSYASLLHAGQDAVVKLVDPGHPEDSVLWLALARKTLRLANTTAPPMPMDALPLSTDEVEAIRLWILAGAPATGVVERVADLVDACPATGGAAEDEYPGDLPECVRDDRSLLLPNLEADPPTNIRVFNARTGRRRLEFTTKVGNTGDGPLIIQAGEPPAGPGHTVDAIQIIMRTDGTKCRHRAGIMRLSDAGDRWAVGNFADFELRKDDPITGAVVASSSKPAFCLVDSEPVHGLEGRPHQFELHCTDPIGRMGISVGYKDTYHRIHPGQWMDLDADPGMAVPPGTYYLVNIADPSNHFWEKDDMREDNANFRILRISLRDPDQGQSPPPEPTVRSTPLPHRLQPTPTPHVSRLPHRQRTPGTTQLRHPLPPAHPVHPRSPHALPAP